MDKSELKAIACELFNLTAKLVQLVDFDEIERENYLVEVKKIAKTKLLVFRSIIKKELRATALPL